MAFYAGLDLGQVSDHSALTIIERTEVEKVAHYALRDIRRWPLGTPYPQIVDDLYGILKADPLAGRCPTIVDGTGVGRAVVGMLDQPPGGLVPCVITGGTRVNCEMGWWYVPKRELCGTVQSLLQSRRLKFAKLALTNTLVRELREFKVKITDAANDVYGTWREGVNDDCVLALALCCWYADRAPRWRPVGFAGEPRRVGGVVSPFEAELRRQETRRQVTTNVYWSPKTQWPTEGTES